MIFTTASALLIAATSAVAAPGLSLKIFGPAQVDNVDNLAVVATIANTGDETLKLFNDPRGTLSAFKANSFAITSASGAAPKFVGAKVKYSFDAAAKSGNAKDFTVLAPGKSIDVTHDLSDAYNFNTTGAGAYKIEASKRFHYLDSAGKVNEIYAQVTDTHTTSLRGKLVSSKVLTRSGLSKRSSFSECRVKLRLRYQKRFSTFRTRISAYTTTNHDLVQSHFANILANNITSCIFSCNCTIENPDSTFAYVHPNEFGIVYLCGAFWTAPTNGTNSKAGTIVHESTHFTKNGGTGDSTYGQDDCQALALSNSTAAVMNADSNEYFAENNPAQS